MYDEEKRGGASMPAWAIHLATATQLNKKLNINSQDKNIFLLGNILPDILNGYVVKNISHQVSHNKTHFAVEVQINNHKEHRHDIQGFYDKYHKQFNNPLILGYYTHIITDTFWNNVTYGGKGIFNEDKFLIGLQLRNGKQIIAPKDNLRKIKTNDFKIFSKHIYEKHLADIPEYDEKMLEYAKDIPWLTLEKQDILETIKYLEEVSSLKKSIELDTTEYQIFSPEEIQSIFDNCIKKILQENL